jgi:hypothetical protein
MIFLFKAFSWMHLPYSWSMIDGDLLANLPN